MGMVGQILHKNDLAQILAYLSFGFISLCGVKCIVQLAHTMVLHIRNLEERAIVRKPCWILWELGEHNNLDL